MGACVALPVFTGALVELAAGCGVVPLLPEGAVVVLAAPPPAPPPVTLTFGPPCTTATVVVGADVELICIVPLIGPTRKPPRF